MEALQIPLEETLWYAPQYLEQTIWQKVTSNSVYHYFSWSPFFDATSNNNIITTQAYSNESLSHVCQNRQLFEDRLKSMQGLEFMVIEDPSENGTKEEHSGTWVIRKQIRKKIYDEQGRQEEDEITPITCYIIMGDTIAMATTIGDVLSNKLVSLMFALNKYQSTASTLPLFTPSAGHTWFPPTSKPLAAAINGRPGRGSKDGTPIPGSPAPSIEGNKGPLAAKVASGSDYQEQKTLAESYHMSLMYGHEYMDENPLVGEPGSFRINKTKEVAPKPVLNITTPFHSAPTDDKTTDSPAVSKKNKGGEKSPITAGTKDKKSRRKSKAASATTTTTPK